MERSLYLLIFKWIKFRSFKKFFFPNFLGKKQNFPIISCGFRSSSSKYKLEDWNKADFYLTFHFNICITVICKVSSMKTLQKPSEKYCKNSETFPEMQIFRKLWNEIWVIVWVSALPCCSSTNITLRKIAIITIFEISRNSHQNFAVFFFSYSSIALVIIMIMLGR